MGLPITVSLELHGAMTEECGLPFADSYLSGASLVGRVLTPHTVTAWERLTGSRSAMMVLRSLEIVLKRPLPFGHPDRADTI